MSRFIDKANKQTRDEIENLISGETVIKEIKQELTYNELDKSIENLWSILFTTGYLTQRERIDSRKNCLNFRSGNGFRKSHLRM